MLSFGGKRFKILPVKCFLLLLGSLLVFLCGCASEPKGWNPNSSVPPDNKPFAVADVYLLPLDDFEYDFANKLAKQLSQDLNIHVKAALNLGTAGLKPYPGTQQYPAEEIIAMAKKVIPNFQDVVPTSSFVVLTRKDINAGDRSLRFNFASGDPRSRVVVVSTARLALDLKNTNIGREVFWLRTYKMTKREIGIVHFGYPRSTDVKDLMYSPIMSLEDVDRMGTEFAAAKK